MGIYLFKRQALIDLIAQDPREDFGKHLIPTKVFSGGVAAFVYQGYWEDIGTLQSFYEANMALTRHDSPFSFHNESRPIFSHHYNLPATYLSQTEVKQSILSEGCIIEADEITGCIIGPRTVVEKGCVIRHSYLMGNEYYTSKVSGHHRLPSEPKIGENSRIFKAIVDKNVCIGKNVQLVNKQKLSHYDSDNIYIRDGIIVIPRGATIPDGFTL